MKAVRVFGCAALCAALALGCFGCSTPGAKQSPLDPNNPTTVTIWDYYNGDQQSAFADLVSEFNSTEGAEKGISVVPVSLASIDNLSDSLLESAEGKVGAQDMPTMAAIYPETAYILKEKDMLANLDNYFTSDELSEYIPSFIEEGRLVEGGELSLFPVSKSTECFAVNETDWAPFEKATGITVDSIDSYEALVDAAQKYYAYTDALTPNVADDGKALYGRDSVANYVFVGAKQLGHEIFKVTKDGVTTDLDRDTFKKMWDNYYIPFINGYFAASSSYRTDDMKTGSIISLTGSTSGASYLPATVTDSKDKTHEITTRVTNPLKFKDGSDTAVQQGAGYCVIKGTEQEEYAASEFLRWFTADDRNLEFSVSSGYSPVKKAANSPDTIRQNFEASSSPNKKEFMLDSLLVSSDIYLNKETYTTKPFAGSKDMRSTIGYAMDDVAVADRAAVVKAMASGKTREEAVATYSTDEYFDAWFNKLKGSVDKTMEKSGK